MDLQLQGKKALVTGSRSGIGESIAKFLAKEKGWGSKREEIEASFIKEIGSIPSNRLGTPEEISATVAFIASPLASYINGANIRVDGGSCFCVN